MPASTLIHSFTVKFDGSAIPELDGVLQEVEVHSALGVASSFMVCFNAQNKKNILEHSAFALGKMVKIESAGIGNSAPITLIEGEITSIEPTYSLSESSTMVIRGYDKSNRLTLGKRHRTFISTSYSSIISNICSERGLTAEVDSISDTPLHVFQDNQSDRDFIEMIARRYNMRVSYSDGKLKVKTAAGTETATLSFGDGDLIEFNPRMNVANIVNEVIVRGWSPVDKAFVEGRKTSSSIQATTEYNKNGVSESSRIFGAATHQVFVPDVKDAAEAGNIAQALLDEFNNGFVEAEGVANGTSSLLAGVKLTVENVGKFSGDYTISSAIHRYSQGDYKVYFSCTGVKYQQMSDMILGSSSTWENKKQWRGVVPAIVTDNNDPDRMARVKVKYPWLDDNLEGFWARVVAPGAGNVAGIHWLPEVNDEVLVAFEGGDFNRPYVLGGLWNGSDKQPEEAAVNNGDVVIYTMQTPGGHIIRLTDTSGSEKIEIIDSKGVSTVTLDGAGQLTELKTTGELKLTATGDITISTDGNLNMSSGANSKLEAGSNLDLTATGTGKLQSTGSLTVKGATVAIN